MKNFIVGVVVGIFFSIGAFFVIAYLMADNLMNSLPDSSLSPPTLAISSDSHRIHVKLSDLKLVEMRNNKLIDSGRLTNKVTVINFWERWCLPCRQELPSLERLRSAVTDTNINIIVVSTQNKAETSKDKMVQEFAIPFFHLEGLTPAAFEGEQVPRTYVVDKLGNVIVREIGAAKWDSKGVLTLLDSLSMMGRKS